LGPGIFRFDGRARDETVIRDYIKNQEKEDQRLPLALIGHLQVAQ